jgi:hypothetical protein
MKTISRVVIIALIAFTFAASSKAEAQYGGWYGPKRGYAYYPPTTWAAPSYVPGPYVPSYGAYYYGGLPPYGFGSPYYNGYSDVYSYRYGPSVRDFLRFGGADFYGW